jgi:hypothetical protein
MIRKPLLILLALSVLLPITACSKKPPQVVTRQAGSSLETLRDMTTAYEKKDLGGFLDAVSVDFPEREALSNAVTGAFKKYATIRFTVQYTKMLIMIDDKGRVKLAFTWDGEWQTAGGRIMKDGGRVTFALDPKGTRITAIEGRNPFVPTEKQQ